MRAEDIQFWTTLIRVTRRPTPEQLDKLQANCTHITGPWWIMEGDTNYLRGEGIRLREIQEGAVGALGGLSTTELKQVCRDSYGVQL